MSRSSALITKTYLYNFDPIKPHFYIVKLGFIGVYIIFVISAQNKDCRYSLEPPRRGGSKEYPPSMFWAKIWKISEVLSENFQFVLVKFSIYLNRRVFVMTNAPKSAWAWESFYITSSCATTSYAVYTPEADVKHLTTSWLKWPAWRCPSALVWYKFDNWL